MKLKIVTLVLMSCLSLQAKAECKNFEGVYTHETEVLTVKQSGCTKITKVLSYSGRANWSQELTFDTLADHQAHRAPGWGFTITSVDAVLILDDMFGRTQVFYEAESDRTQTSAETFRLDKDGNLTETFVSADSKGSFQKPVIKLWMKSQQLPAL